jgi:hypothetical protein
MKKSPYPPIESLKQKLTITEIEARFEQESSELGLTLSPAWVERWNKFKDQARPGDEIWYWEYFPAPLTGGAGYCLVRDGVNVAVIVTFRS